MSKTYRQVTHKLRVQRGPGRPHLESTRPNKKDSKDNRVYTDSDEKPTLVEFDEHCQVDIPFLLQLGAIEEYIPPRPKRAPKPAAREEVKADGQSRSQPG